MQIFKRIRRWYLRKFHGIITVTRPTGTVSVLSRYSEGIHPPYQQNYQRRVNLDEVALQWAKDNEKDWSKGLPGWEFATMGFKAGATWAKENQ